MKRNGGKCIEVVVEVARRSDAALPAFLLAKTLYVGSVSERWAGKLDYPAHQVDERVRACVVVE